MEGSPQAELGKQVSPTDFQRLGSAAIQYEVPFAAELPANLHPAYELLMLHGADYEAVREGLNLERAEEVASIELDLTRRAFRRLARISHMIPGLDETLSACVADRHAGLPAEESQKNEEADKAAQSHAKKTGSTARSSHGGRSNVPRSSRRAAPTSAASFPKKRPKKPPQVRSKPKAPPKTKPPKPPSMRERLRDMGDALTAEGRDPLILLQDDWAMQRAFWLLTTTDAPIVKIRSSLNRRVQIGTFAQEIMRTLRCAAPDIFGTATAPGEIPPPPPLGDRWLQGEKHTLIGLIAAKSADLQLDIGELFSEAPQTYVSFLVLSVSDISFSEARTRLGVTISYLSTAINRIVNSLSAELSSDELRDLRYKVRSALAQRPLTDPSSATAPDDFPWRQTILRMHDILTARGGDPVALLSSQPELQALYPLLVDKQHTPESIMAQTGFSFRQLDTLEVNIQNILPQLAPTVLGFVPSTSGADQLRQSLAEQDWRWGERRFVVPAISEALTRHGISPEQFLTGKNLKRFQILADPDVATRVASDTEYHVTNVVSHIIETLFEKAQPGVLEIAEVRKTALELYERQKKLPRESDEKLVGDCAAGRVAFVLMEQQNLNFNALTVALAAKFGFHKKTFRKFLQGEAYSHPDKMLVLLLEEAGIKGKERQELIASYQAERKQHDGRLRNRR